MHTNNLFRSTTGVDTELESDLMKERIRLPIKFKGMGMRSLFDRRHAEFMGGMM